MLRRDAGKNYKGTGTDKTLGHRKMADAVAVANVVFPAFMESGLALPHFPPYSVRLPSLAVSGSLTARSAGL